MWDKYEEAKMGIVVRHIKRFVHSLSKDATLLTGRPASTVLPDYVFDEGERHPRPALKRPKATKVRICPVSNGGSLTWLKAEWKVKQHFARPRSEQETTVSHTRPIPDRSPIPFTTAY